MSHDHRCELNSERDPYKNCDGPDCNLMVMHQHCHCLQRGYPLCAGCRRGDHLAHTPHVEDIGATCACDLEEAA